jgi:hypothetical protein
VAVAKVLEYLHNGPCMTDVGCTYKLFTRRTLAELLPLLTVGDSHVSPEILIVTIRMKLRCIEIPVNYGPRLGTSKVTGSLVRAIKLGLRMILLIFRYELITFSGACQAEARQGGFAAALNSPNCSAAITELSL